MTDTSVHVVGYARTPFGRFGGALRGLTHPQLGAIATQAALARADAPPEAVDELVIGVNFPGSDRSIARQIQLRAGIPDARPSYTVDRACCSSLSAITLASRSIRLGEARIAVAGGVDNLSRVPYFIEDARFGRRLGDITLTDQLIVTCPHTGVPRAVQAGREAVSVGIGRAEQDAWAVRSQQRYQAAADASLFDDEIVPVDTTDDDGDRIVLGRDESPRPDTSLEALATLPTVYGSPTVTAGTAPNLSSGASALVLAADDAIQTGSVTSKARLHGWTMVSGDPQLIASIPATAARAALDKTGIELQDVDIFEINEAFAAVPLVTALTLAGGATDVAAKILDRTNVNGGAVAIGHPTGATGGRLVMTAIAELTRRGGGVGLVAICGGIGEGEAVVVQVP